MPRRIGNAYSLPQHPVHRQVAGARPACPAPLHYAHRAPGAGIDAPGQALYNRRMPRRRGATPLEPISTTRRSIR